ncbi:MAG: Lrp/AsnC family transcriptional regulator [Candidatus Thorarchaeota archaeon]
MDSIDRGIILDLSRNCRTTLHALSRTYGISSNAIRKRVTKLEETGVIEKFLVQLSWAMADVEQLFAILYTDKSIDDDSLAEKVFEHPFVASVHFDSYGACIVKGEYSGTKQLADMGGFLRGVVSVNRVEIHTVPIARGRKVELTNLQMRVLVPLLDDPRMSITNIAKQTKLTARRVRRTILELYEGGGINFTASLVLSAAESTSLAFRIRWDSKEIEPERIDSIIKKEFPNQYYRSKFSAMEPLMWIDFMVEHPREAEIIAGTLRGIPSVVIENTIITFPPKKSRHLREQKLRKLLEDAGFLQMDSKP